MKLILPVVISLSLFLGSNVNAQVGNQLALAKSILADSSLDTIQARAVKLLSGFSAGTSYNEVWIRDFNTFIKGSLKAHPKEEVKNNLLMFFKI